VATDDTSPPEAVLITGFPAFTAKRLAVRVLDADPRATVYLLTRDKFAADAQQFLAALPRGCGHRAEVVIGDVCDMDLGLSGDEFRALRDQVTTIHHLAGIYFMGVDRPTAERVNVQGTRNVLELAGEAKKLRRLCHWSTAAVSGKRKGIVLEEELEEGQSFHNFYEETKFEAERLARQAQRQLPITVFRPGIMVGDSTTGEIDKFDGPYYLLVLIATNSLHVRVPLPGRGTAPMHLVPVDFVIQAAYQLAVDERAAGMTFHLTDPNPFAARRVYELVAEQSQARLPRTFLPTTLARTLFRAPGLERLARAPLWFLESLNQQCFYNCRHTLELLDRSGVRCPAFDTYVENLVRYIRVVHQARKQPIAEEVFDPLE
jgi:thioester reductase-like protein